MCMHALSPGRTAGALMVTLGLTPCLSYAYTEATLPHPVGVVDQTLYDEAHDAGAYWMRVPVQWKYVERSDDQFTWGAYDGWLAEMEARDINMTPVLVIGKVWANWQLDDPWGQNDPPESLPEFDGSPEGASRVPNDLEATYNPAHGYSASYYDFVYQWVSRYGDVIDRITIENEVNAANFWESQINGYRRILATARKAALDANPNVLVFESGMGSGSWGVAIADDRYDDGQGVWTPTETIAFIKGYYARDIFVQSAFGPTLAAMDTQGELESFLALPSVQDNNTRVTTVLDNLYSTDLDMMLVDGLNLKFTGDDWYVDELVGWINERIDAGLPRAARGVLPLPMVNNEASNWCVDGLADYDDITRRCNLEPGDGLVFAREMIRKVVRGIGAGVGHSIWFPLSNANIVATPRIGLYDYDGDRLETADAFTQMSRFIGWSRDYTRVDVTGDVSSFVFTERALGREDVRVLWWDDGSHGAGGASVSIDVPESTIRAVRYTMVGDSLELPIVSALGAGAPTVDVQASEDPVFVYFDDGVTPAYEVEPVLAPVPPVVVLAAPAPNPSSGLVRIQFGVPEEIARAVVDVFDMTGRRVVRLYEGRLTEGVYRLRWDGRTRGGDDVGAGTYVVRLATGSGAESRKIVLVR